jgi:hypothetical protein
MISDGENSPRTAASRNLADSMPNHQVCRAAWQMEPAEIIWRGTTVLTAAQ